MANNLINPFETSSKIQRSGLNMATRSTIESSCYRSASVIAKDSEPEIDDPSSSAPASNITQRKKTTQYVDQVQFDSI